MDSKFDKIEENSHSSESDSEEEKDGMGSLAGEAPKAEAPKPPRQIPKSKITFVKKEYSPLKWEDFFDARIMINDEIPLYTSGTRGPLLFCLHGAGLSALSFAALARETKDDLSLAAFDFRGHGASQQPDVTNLDQSVLIDDAVSVLNHVIQMPEFEDRSILVVGHSMGGAIASKLVAHICAEESLNEIEQRVKGYFVIDVVEGSAIEVLPMMEHIVKSRPQSFKSLEQVVEYGYRNNLAKYLDSARVSMPDQVVYDEETKEYKWKVDLLESKQYWTDWFTGLTQSFLDNHLPKLLCLASNDRMDKELTIAHMMGKFKLVVLPDVGHAIQEDDPKGLALAFLDFISTFSISEKASTQRTITSIGGKKIVINA